ncbi:MAG: hypothetical protein F4Z71_08195 [Gammaproteobacteria bacterium]|nr:hypothetical protein [Gammaproteobacteria bacterium]MYE29276.1 hypothetical protein [Gammaproteobacteria bacterium]
MNQHCIIWTVFSLSDGRGLKAFTPHYWSYQGAILDLEEYKNTGRFRYERLTKVVSQLLERAIANEPRYRLQQIQPRAKTVESLRRRLDENGQITTDEIEAHRKDLAGCRVVFYTNNDVDRFASSGLLTELFDVDWERSTFHQPGPAQHSANQLFQSYNYVLKLKSDRTALLEYRELEGLYCEVQVQTSLNHAWAEMAHDTIYKRPNFQGFGTRQLELIESRLEDAMRKYLLPAGYLFQQIAADVDRLAEGKALFDSGVLDMALSAANNNDRYNALTQLKDYVLPHFDNPLEVFPEIRDKLKQTWLVAGETETVPHETPFGGFQGWEPHQVTAQIAEILNRYRYLDPDETYTFIRDLFVQTTDSKSRDQLVELAEHLARPTMQIWEKNGPVVQVRLAEALVKEPDIDSIEPIAITIAGEILCPEITGTTSSSTAVTIHRGAVTHSQELERARRSAIDVISGIAQAAIGDDEVLMRATRSLFESGRWPRTGGLGNEAVIMILEDLAYAIECMLPIAADASLNARQNLESMLLRCWRLNRSLPNDLESEPEAVAAHKRLISSMLALREALSADEEFEVFKTIVGYRSIFPHQWEEERRDLKRDEAARNQRQDELAGHITEENWLVWKSRLEIAARLKSTDRATFPPFGRFLSAVATRQPRLAFDLLVDRSVLPDWTIKPIATALLDGELREDVEDLLGRWIDDGCCLSEIAELATSVVDGHVELASKVASHAVNKRDEIACTILVLGAFRHYEDDPQFWRDEVFFPCLKVLGEVANHDWITNSWHPPGKDSLFANLTEDQSRNVLAAMLSMRRIDYEAEQILKSIALTRHQMVLDWFGQRIQVSRQEPLMEFDSVSSSFLCLHEVLQPHLRDILASIRQWSDPDDCVVGLDAMYFLSKVYPKFEEPLSNVFLDLVHNADAAELAFLASSLRGFDGKPELIPVLRAMLASEAASGDTEGQVSEILLETGMMTGEFGGAETYQEKIELLKPWLDDKNTRVAKFAAREISSLTKLVASENRHAQGQIAMRRIQYGEPLEGDDAHQHGDNSPE